MYSGRTLFSAIALLMLPLAACEGELQPNPSQGRPNVLLIVSDNQSPSLLGAYGNEQISTPNIDRLATNGVLFRNAYAASGVCSPTRASLLTGLMPSQHGVHNALPADPKRIAIPYWSAIEEFRTLPKTLADAGYNTALIGKYHLGTHDKAQLGFQHWVTMETGHTKSFTDTAVIRNGKRVQVAKHITEYWTDEAIEYLQQQSDNQPFFLFLSYNGPYMLPPVVTGPSASSHADRYRQNVPEFPQEPVHEFLRNWASASATPNEHMKAESTHAWAAIGALNNKHAMVNTAAETSTVDDGVGRILQELEERGLAENTLVIYTSDQGSAYGQHGLWGNTSWAFPFPAYDAHLKVPFIVQRPGAIPGGRETDLLVRQADLFPTILDHIGLRNVKIENAAGVSLEPLLTSREKLADEPVFFEFILVRGVRTTEWKYVKRFPDGPNELYAIQKDPKELDNLIDEPSLTDTVAKLSDMVDAYFSATANPVYDLWQGGTGKGRLLSDYGMERIFSERFSGWRPPFIEKATPFEEQAPR